MSPRTVRRTIEVHAGSGVTYNAPVHRKRRDSNLYRATRAALARIVASLGPDGWLFGRGDRPFDDHHGGGLWVMDEHGWLFVRNLVGIEWAAQFCADPKKVDRLRTNARRLYAAFPRSFDAMRALGVDLRALLDTPIRTARDVARWTDSICNASVPLPAPLHTGVLPAGAGVHEYPTPVTDIDRVRRDDFPLFVRDERGHAIAAAPARANGRGALHVLHAPPGSALHAAHVAALARGGCLELPREHPLALAVTERGRTAPRGRRRAA